MRPVGAFIFGLMADRYGRRLPLMIDVIFYSVVEVLTGLAPSYRSFLILRLLYGIGMGGEWGVGASLAMESVPAKWRGVLSGVLQEGYALGYLLAAVAYFWSSRTSGGGRCSSSAACPRCCRCSSAPRCRKPTPGSERRSRTDWGDYVRAVGANWKRFLYLVALMAMMNLISHGTQDMYPTFLQRQPHSLRAHGDRQRDLHARRDCRRWWSAVVRSHRPAPRHGGAALGGGARRAAVGLCAAWRC